MAQEVSVGTQVIWMLHAQSRLRCEVDDGKSLHQRLFHQENAEHQKTVISGVMVKQNVLKKCVTRSCCDLTHFSNISKAE